MTGRQAEPRFRKHIPDRAIKTRLGKAELVARPDELRTNMVAPTTSTMAPASPPIVPAAEPSVGQDQPGMVEATNLAQQALEIVQSLPPASSDTAADAAAYRLIDIAPRDAIEQMLATQMLALHAAMMDCSRRAMLPGLDSEFRREELGLAGRVSRSFAQLVDTLDRRRRGGEQKVTVKHVHVHAGGQAIVGTVDADGAGASRKWQKRSHAV